MCGGVLGITKVIKLVCSFVIECNRRVGCMLGLVDGTRLGVPNLSSHEASPLPSRCRLVGSGLVTYQLHEGRIEMADSRQRLDKTKTWSTVLPNSTLTSDKTLLHRGIALCMCCGAASRGVHKVHATLVRSCHTQSSCDILCAAVIFLSCILCTYVHMNVLGYLGWHAL